MIVLHGVDLMSDLNTRIHIRAKDQPFQLERTIVDDGRECREKLGCHYQRVIGFIVRDCGSVKDARHYW